MNLPTLRNLRSAATVRAYPVGVDELAGAVGAAIRRLPRWELVRSSGREVQAVRRTRLGFKDDVTITFAAHEEGARAECRSVSRFGLWDLGQNRRNLRELSGFIDKELATGG